MQDTQQTKQEGDRERERKEKLEEREREIEKKKGETETERERVQLLSAARRVSGLSPDKEYHTPTDHLVVVDG